MNFAVILSGGVGTRMELGDFPKQYVEVCGKPIIMYTLERFQSCADVDGIVVVAASTWQPKISEWIKKWGIAKFLGFAAAGATRQHSILNGLTECVKHKKSAADTVTIHDAVRPLVSEKLVSDCIRGLEGADGCMPVLPIKDTVYTSADGKIVTGLTVRSELFAGQAPESFRLDAYYAINKDLSDAELAAITGTSAIAFEKGLKVAIIPGDEKNYKLTTPADLERFKAQTQGGEK